MADSPKRGRCSSCQWWERFSNTGSCNYVDMPSCRTDAPKRFELVQGRDADGEAADEDSAAILFTGPDFGCVHHNPKETSDEPVN